MGLRPTVDRSEWPRSIRRDCDYEFQKLFCFDLHLAQVKMAMKAMKKLIKIMWTAAVARLFRLWAENKYMDNIGILAYDSLINDPGNEIISATIKRIKTRTPFNVEFARSSSGRGGAPTLVPVAIGGAKVNAFILVLRHDISIQEAKNWLYRREINRLSSDITYRVKVNPGPNDVVVEEIEKYENVTTVLYTRIAANISPLTPERLAELAIESAKDRQVAEQQRDGIHYLISAQNNGITTPLASRYESEILARAGANSLREAFQNLQS